MAFSATSKKKKPRLNVSKFFMEEADEADSDEDFDDDEDVLGEKEQREISQAEADALALHKKRREAENLFEKKTVEEITNDVMQRYRSQALPRAELIGARGAVATDVSQRSLVPSVNDPTIWMVRCKVGLERQLVRSIMLKCLKSMSEGKRVGLKTAFSTATKGYIYLEAFEEASARVAINGLNHIFHTSFKIVPILEMTPLLSVSVKKKPLKPGVWVRVKKGVLKGDLAKVLSVSEGADTAVIQAIPRIDYSPPAAGAAADKKAKSTARPLQAPFDATRLTATHRNVERRQFPPTGEMCHFYDGNYYKNGFLLKELRIDIYLTDLDVVPRLEELTMFRVRGGSARNDDDDDEEADGERDDQPQQMSIVQELAQLGAQPGGQSKKRVSLYRPGDTIQIIGGEIRLIGRIVSIDDAGGLVQVKPLTDFDLPEMTVEIAHIAKYIKPGSHVKVIEGQHVGQTGRVVSVNMTDGSLIAAIFTDGIQTEITVNVDHLQVTNEVTVGLNSLEGYELYDFVTLNSNEVGVVIMVGTDQLSVLTQQDIVKNLKPMEIRGKANAASLRSQSVDHMLHEMHVGDTVTVMEGPFVKKVGTIKHIYKAIVWLHCDTYFKNSGIFPVRGRSCALAGSMRRDQSMGPPTGGFSGGRGGGRGGPGGRGGRGRGDDNVGKTVKITTGAYKGHLAVVRSTTDTDYTLELATKLKQIRCPISQTVIVGDKQGSLNRVEQPGIVGGIASTPFLLSQTPLGAGGMTPNVLAGSETPLNAGDSTPRGNETPSAFDVWKPSAADADRLRAAATSGISAMGSHASMSSPYSMDSRQPSSTYTEWDKDMVVTFTMAPRIGRLGVLRGKANYVSICI
jgi:transcription elongation factor SPT5